MDRLDELEVLIAIIDEGSLIGAARRLRRSPPAVTRTLAMLEDRVGERLVERTTRKLSATERGFRLAERARTMLTEYEAMMTEGGFGPLCGLLRVTAPVQFGRRHVAPLVSSFLDAFPDMQVELVLNDRNLDLIEEGLDVAVRIGHLDDSTLLVRRVGEVRRVLVASPDYLARHGAPQTPEDLSRHATIFGTLRSGSLEWRFEVGGRTTVVRLRPRLLVNEIEAQLIAARAGRGIARLLSYQVADDVATGSLVRLLPAFEPPPWPVQLVVRGGRHMAPKIRAFLDHAGDALRKLPVIHGPAEEVSDR
ncbi:LysR family transcriptional regulator [Telmatospirillum siberiense]|uniref:Transcriptional regulator n=1 Tax=Telmatospirillum siberiense TaxID=382514 RepID=A0A2N3PN42_9PROT|nr:LysR family transcriptional regulator [Telmatospirillum siberiense]PKU21814.1 transcriptional regulator [Telmatospirillum siberiense]